MKGPGLRIEIDVRRAWRCPTCGQSQRLTMDITAPRCFCVRDGVPMKLVEGQRPDRLDLRPELRSMLDRIQGGEEFARMTSPLTDDSERGSHDGGSRPRDRPPRPERSSGNENRPPREPRPAEAPQVAVTAEPMAVPVPSQVVAEPPPRSPASPDEDDFGAGLGVGEPSAPN